MASAEAALVAILTGGSPNPVAAIVGTRVYPDVLPQSPILPAIRYQRISTPRPFRALERPRAEYATPRFQIDMWAVSKSQVLALAEAVLAAVEGFSGTSAGLQVDDISAEDEGGEFEENVLAGGAGAYRSRLDVILWHPES